MEGSIRHEGQEIIMVDLPGAYSLSAYSQEEVVARNVLLGGAVQAVINVVNAGILERGLLRGRLRWPPRPTARRLRGPTTPRLLAAGKPCA